MAEPGAPLDSNTLRKVHELVEAMQDQHGRGVPRKKLVDLAGDDAVRAGLTVHVDPTGVLANPLVVLRVPAEDEPSACFRALTPRELEVAKLVAQGHRNRDIAVLLCLSVGTIKDHVHRILSKTELPSRAAIAAAYLGKEYERRP